MYNKILEHLTTGCRALIAAVLLIAGIIWQAAAGKLLDQTAFYLMAAAMLCFATVIFTKCKPDMIQYVIGNMIVLIIGSTKLPKQLLRKGWTRLKLIDAISSHQEQIRFVAASIFTVLVLYCSVAFLVSGSYNPFLYFRF